MTSARIVRQCLALFGLLGLLSAVAANGYGFSDPGLAQAAARYQALVANSRAATDPVRTWQRAANAVKEKHWPRAIAAYEALIAAGDQAPRRWLQLARAWNEADSQRDHLQRALQAAYNAWQGASDDTKLRASTLFLLGHLYQRNDQPRQALAAWRSGLALHDNTEIRRRYHALKASLQFRVEGLDVERASATPRLCLRFSQPLAHGPQIHLADYLTIEPAIQAVVEAHDNRLCIGGVSFGQRYRITIQPGVPAASGERTGTRKQFSATVGDRPARVGFRGRAYVLPEQGAHSLPLTTVNVERVRLTLLRINDRNLTTVINAGNLLASLDGYARRQIAQRSGAELWSGTLSIADQRNADVTTAVPLGPLLAHTAPGIYVVTAADASKPEQRWRDLATQWLVVSDIGITSLRGSDGLHVFLRSLASARPLTDITVKLYARNNSELGTAHSDSRGQVQFAAGLLAGNGGREPAAVMVYGDHGDFNFLDLTRPAFDLSDRGVAGHKAPGPVDAYLYSDRGIYRPGATVQLVALLRDSQGHQLPGTLPLTLRLIRPDQVASEQQLLHDVGQGAYHAALRLPPNARSGNWQVRVLLDPKGTPVGQLQFQVQDFQPQRLRVRLRSSTDQLTPGKAASVSVAGAYLYGAPAAHLNTSAELVLRADPKPYPDHPGFHFGLAGDQFSAQRLPLSSGPTDSDGNARFSIMLDQRPTTSLPLQALIRVSLFDPGGQTVNQTLALPYRDQPYAIGIKPLFHNQVAQGKDFGFQVIALDAAGQLRPAQGLRYRLYREDYQFYWYYQDSRWNYKRIVRNSQPLTSGAIDLPAAAPYTLRQPGLDWGSYRLEIYDPADTVASSIRFQVGWVAGGALAGAPDQLQLSLDHNSYQAGQSARIHLKAPFAGSALVMVVSDKLWLTRSVDLPAGGTTIDLPVTPAWSPGVYVLASAFRPATAAGRGPGRAVGVAWLGLDPAPRTLGIHLSAPPVWRPRRPVQVPVHVTGLQAGDEAYVTLAAVDQGILQLTDFTSPDPGSYFLGKRRLGMDLLDLYGHLIRPGGQPGKLRNGAGADNRNLHPGALRSTRTVALFSGPVRLDSQGNAMVPLQLPDFEGELRLMAVAWGGRRYGAASEPVKVRDPLVSQLYLPRFLAPGDQALITLALHNLDAPAGRYTVSLKTAGSLTLDQPAQQTLGISKQGADSTRQLQFTLHGGPVGDGRLTLDINGPTGFHLQRHWNLSVRPAQAYVSNHRSQQLAAGATLHIDHSQLSGYLPGTGLLSASFSSHPALNVPALLRALQDYPYGCLEQLTSRALALLYYGNLARSWQTPEAGSAADSAGHDPANPGHAALRRRFRLVECRRPGSVLVVCLCHGSANAGAASRLPGAWRTVPPGPGVAAPATRHRRL